MAAALRLASEKAQIGSRVGAISENRVGDIAAQGGQTREFIGVRVEDRRGARCQKRSEQPVFRAPVIRHVAVVVQMIPGEVGERSRGYRQTVEPTLVKTVARGLDRRVFDAVRGEASEITMERGRVRSSEGSGTSFGGGHQAKCAEARGRQTEPRPDLAGEMNDRRLAVGAGDGRNDARLPAIKACR